MLEIFQLWERRVGKGTIFSVNLKADRSVIELKLLAVNPVEKHADSRD